DLVAQELRRHERPLLDARRDVERVQVAVVRGEVDHAVVQRRTVDHRRRLRVQRIAHLMARLGRGVVLVRVGQGEAGDGIDQRVASPVVPVPSSASVIELFVLATRLAGAVRFAVPRYVKTRRVAGAGMTFAAPPASTFEPSTPEDQKLRAVSLKKPVVWSIAGT